VVSQREGGLGHRQPRRADLLYRFAGTAGRRWVPRS
jgi:hypothetical protein